MIILADQSLSELTYETVHVVRVAGIVWDGEAAVTDGHLTLSKGQCKITQLIQQAAQCLKHEQREIIRFMNNALGPSTLGLYKYKVI